MIGHVHLAAVVGGAGVARCTDGISRVPADPPGVRSEVVLPRRTSRDGVGDCRVRPVRRRCRGGLGDTDPAIRCGVARHGLLVRRTLHGRARSDHAGGHAPTDESVGRPPSVPGTRWVRHLPAHCRGATGSSSQSLGRASPATRRADTDGARHLAGRGRGRRSEPAPRPRPDRPRERRVRLPVDASSSAACSS